MAILKCVFFLLILGVASHIIGEAIPRESINENARLFCEFSWEQGGAFYEKLNIRKWKDRLPDKSKFVKRMTPKRFEGVAVNSDSVSRLIKETCISEITHYVISILSFLCVFISRRIGFFVFLLFTLSNLPFALIQRYNRPRLRRLYSVLKKKEDDRDRTADVL